MLQIALECEYSVMCYKLLPSVNFLCEFEFTNPIPKDFHRWFFIYILGGIRIFRASANGEIIFEEQSESSETVRPWYLINGTESQPRVRRIASFMDTEIAASHSLQIPLESGSNCTTNYKFYPVLDGKLTRE